MFNFDFSISDTLTFKMKVSCKKKYKEKSEESFFFHSNIHFFAYLKLHKLIINKTILLELDVKRKKCLVNHSLWLDFTSLILYLKQMFSLISRTKRILSYHIEWKSRCTGTNFEKESNSLNRKKTQQQ